MHPYSIFLRHCLQTALKLACTAFMALHTMLVYRNQQFWAYTVQTGMYSLGMAVAGGQLSHSISSKTCTQAYVSCCTWFNHVQQLTYAKMQKCFRKADHLQQQFLRSLSTYLSEQCMHQIADSCTLALYVGP